MRLHFIIFLLIVPLVLSDTIPFEDCGSIFYLKSVHISECNRHPCHLRIGNTYNVTAIIYVCMSFGVANESIMMDLRKEVFFEVNKVRQDASVISDPCLDSKTSYELGPEICKPQTGHAMEYRATLKVNLLPPLPATLYWKLINKQGDTLVCYKVKVILKIV